MTVRRKIFIALMAFIVALSLLFVWVTNLVVKESLQAIVDASIGKELDGLTSELRLYYREHRNSWNGVRLAELHPESWLSREEVSFALLSKGGITIAQDGPAYLGQITHLGIERIVQAEGAAPIRLYYYDPETANLSKLRIGITVSVTLLMAAAAVLLLLLSIPAAYGIARHLTAPLGKLIEAIDRLGKGDYGARAALVSGDEYGKVACAFNGMSAELGQAERRRRHLMADVAHELRTPLTIVQGRLDLLQQDGRPVEPERLLPLQDELIRLTRLVDDLHQLAQAESGKLTMERRKIELRELLQRVIERVSVDAELKNLSLTLTDRSAGGTVMGDADRLAQVFLNLLVNAVRYAPQGGAVDIAVADEPAAAGQHPMLRITVADNGPGIAPEHLPYLFDRFYRADEGRSRDSGGMGLGLAIAKGFVLAHGGSIEAASVPGEGTAMIVRLQPTGSDADRDG